MTDKTPEQVEMLAVHERMRRLQSELDWLKQAWTRGDIRVKMATLMMEHFQELNNLSVALASLIRKVGEVTSEEEFGRMQEEIILIAGSLSAATMHNERFKELFEELPDKYDMMLATVDTPRHMM